ncbi:MAG TPA: response regulator [Verrucomicrobia bacterium]|mgnify:CR=1 FL=1|nr:response regulator [Verrucomicrobiota bacterium]HOP96223.1 response regulator [Verrucomicrobiota bacterium]HPU56087.1 response regulator [Verrucomicrobiota bacterium]
MSETILYVDDSMDDVMLFKAACRAARVTFNVQAVKDGEEALSYLGGLSPYSDREKYPMPSLVMLDLKMPRVSGFDVLEWLRNRSPSALQQLPVIVFTSSIHEEDRRRALELGANEYCVKPGRFKELLALSMAIEEALKNPKDWKIRIPSPAPPSQAQAGRG